MRIIAGEAKGRTLYAPSGEGTRPTSDKLRGALFNILYGRVAGSRVLDVFGGTGALALEALSRGAEYAVVIDADRNAIRAIRRNAQAVLGENAEQRLRVLQADYRSAISLIAGEKFRLVFLDPPYRMTEAYADALTRLFSAGCLADSALIVLERSRDAHIALPDGFVILDSRDYGETSVDFVELAVREDVAP